MIINIFLFFLCLIVAIITVTFIQHVFLTVPYIPTPQHVVDAMIAAANLQGNETVYDLGAGDARLLITAKRKYPGVIAKGCELIWIVWMLGRYKIKRSGLDVQLVRENVYAVDVSDADVIYLYLFPSMMGKLAARFDGMLKPGTKVISHAFLFPGREPEKTIEVSKKKIRVYRW